jgi:CheY-like chemotaxis protein
MRDLLQLEGVTIHDVGTAKDALAQLSSESFDCVVLDLHLPDASGYDILETMSGNERYSFPPVIVYTGGPLTAEDEARLRRLSKSVIVKGARSPERLLDEVTLFLHQVESRLPPDSRRMLQAGAPLGRTLRGRLGLEVRMIVMGGESILRQLHEVRGDVYRQRPVLRRQDWLYMIWRAVIAR